MSHLKQIAALLADYNLDALLITSPPGEHYALGFEGEGVCIVTHTAVHYSTDGRYIEMAQEVLPQVDVLCVGGGKSHQLLAENFISRQAIQRLGFESGYMTVDSNRRWQVALPQCSLLPAQGLLDSLRASKDGDELVHMAEAQRLTDAAFQDVLDYIEVGRTEQEIAAFLVYRMMARGATKVSFDPIVASGPNGSRPHAIPTSRQIQQGDFITMDFGCMVGGYCSDMTRTVALGQPSPEMELVYNTVLEAQLAGLSAVRSGVRGCDVDGAARSVIERAGYGPYFSHSFGHSLGLEIHESPNAAPSCQTPLPAGAVISAEPGIYLPGRFGVRIEDVFVVEETGCRILTQSPKHLHIL